MLRPALFLSSWICCSFKCQGPLLHSNALALSDHGASSPNQCKQITKAAQADHPLASARAPGLAAFATCAYNCRSIQGQVKMCRILIKIGNGLVLSLP
ncbi:hypothetical protein HDK64DRAFT_262366 [Phyllosticta capitalensis]